VQMAIDEDITNTPRPRTIGCIVLDPVGIGQKYRLMSLESGRKVSGCIVQSLPATDEVVNRVHELGEEQSQPRIHDGRLLFEWRPGVPVDGDFYLLDDQNEAAFPTADVLPDPIADGDDAKLQRDEPEVVAIEVTEDDEEHSDNDVDPSSSENDNPDISSDDTIADSSESTSSTNILSSEDSESDDSSPDDECDDGEFLDHDGFFREEGEL